MIRPPGGTYEFQVSKWIRFDHSEPFTGSLPSLNPPSGSSAYAGSAGGMTRGYWSVSSRRRSPETDGPVLRV